MKSKIYAAAFPSGYGSDLIVSALAEDGEGLASHMSSCESWAMHDIGLTSEWKHEIYNEHYPDGWEMVWVNDPATHEGWQSALKLNREKYPEEVNK